MDPVFRDAAKRFPDSEIGNHVKAVDDNKETFEKAIITRVLSNISMGKHEHYNSKEDIKEANLLINRFAMGGG